MERVRGTISWLLGNGDHGFIKCDKGGTIFFHCFNCLPDALARRRWKKGTRVEYEVGVDARNRRQAVRITNLDPTLAQVDLDSYREDSVVVGIDAHQGRGYLERKNRDQLSFRIGNVITEGELSVGVHVRHGIGIWETVEDGRIGFYAKELEIYETPPEPIFEKGSFEEFFYTSPGIPVESMEHSKSPTYSDADRKKSLRQLIAESKAK